MSIGSRLQHAFNSFRSNETTPELFPFTSGPVTTVRPDRPRTRIYSERTIISSIYTRLAVDVAGVKIEHCRTDENGVYKETIKSGLNNCFTVEANIDQAARHFRTDIPLTLFSEGVIAIMPVETTLDPRSSGNWDVKTMRVGTIVAWKPQEVQVRAYDERIGTYQDVWLPKSLVAVVENPFYGVMNEPNSTLQRLVHKLNLLDNVDEISSSGKLDIIIQLPYVVKTETRRNQAKKRREELQEQLQDSTYGIAYTDGSEKITQLNRAVENNLLEQVDYLQKLLYSQLGLTPEIMNGTADDTVMLNYFNRTIEPVMDAITEAISRTFLTKTARTQGQTMMYFQTPFKMLSISELAKVADVLSRNQIVTPNEIRPALGLKPSKEPQADQLVNSNMPTDKQITSDPAAPPELAAPEAVDPADAEEAALNQKMADLGLQ